MTINMNGVLRACPDAVKNVDFMVMDHGDGKGPQLVWLNESKPAPALEEVRRATAEWRAEQDALAYRDLRAAEYPPQSDFIDAQVKKASTDPAVRAAGEAQEAAYFAACQAVKVKFPKP